MAVVERLSIAPASATELARRFELALPSFMQHLGVLEHAGIVTSHKSGRTRTYQLAPSALDHMAQWLVAHKNHWHRRLDQLDQMLVTPELQPDAHPAPAAPASPRSMSRAGATPRPARSRRTTTTATHTKKDPR